ncbi:hypothetical protein ACOXXX_08815 [Thalassococcus sp. BH17M4-6]|uniref:hypothetical protein n=1 Tax=Thalassococcus sp. BH17M4-6 TaxID=3413148 RepID=UPI003BC7E10A
MSHLDSQAARTVATGLGQLRFTLVFLGIMLGANALAGTFSGQIDPLVLAARGIGVDAIGGGDPSRFLTAIFLSHDLPMLLRQLVFAATVIGAAEWRWGTWRAAALFFGIDLSATLILLATVALVPVLDSLAGVTDVGMSMGGFGLIGVLVATGRLRWVGLAAILALVAAKYAVAPEPLADLGHVIALLIGAAIGIYGCRTRGRTVLPTGVLQVRRPGRPGARQQDGRT